MLAVLYGLTKFKQYVYGHKVIVESDHKPLVGQCIKPLAEYSPRIQRMRLHLQTYDFQIVYKPGKELFIADTLSRAPLAEQFHDDVTQSCEEQVFSIAARIVPSSDTRAQFTEATVSDPSLVVVRELLYKAWPDHKSSCPVPAKPFWNVRHDLSEVDGLLLYGERLVVPSSLRRKVLEGLHAGHLGEKSVS